MLFISESCDCMCGSRSVCVKVHFSSSIILIRSHRHCIPMATIALCMLLMCKCYSVRAAPLARSDINANLVPSDCSASIQNAQHIEGTY